MQQRLGEEYPQFREAMEQRPKVSIRLNPRKDVGLFTEARLVSWCATGRYLEKRPAFVWDPLYHAGAYYAQEASSMFFANAIDFSQPLRVLDLCAAPGGKSSLVLSRMHGEGLLVSNELVGKRAVILYENIVKWGAANAVVTSNRASDFEPFEGYFDVVLVDAPCSGEGMFRKDSGAIEQWSEGLVNQCSIIQKEILESAVELVAPGGTLIYSTCTFENQENEDNIRWLYEHYGDKLEPIDWAVEPAWGLYQVNIETPQGIQKGFYSFPHRVEGEGLFLAAMRVSGGKKHKGSPGKGQKPFRPLNKAEMDAVRPYVHLEKDMGMYLWKENVLLLPEAYTQDIAAFMSRLHVKKAGINAGTLNRGQFIPEHELAMSGLASEGIPRVPLGLEEALAYMQRKSVTVGPEVPKGWILFTYQGIDIGWGKNLGSRVNIHYPAEWRIRKEPVLNSPEAQPTPEDEISEY